jgi:hypothetical protein
MRTTETAGVVIATSLLPPSRTEGSPSLLLSVSRPERPLGRAEAEVVLHAILSGLGYCGAPTRIRQPDAGLFVTRIAISPGRAPRDDVSYDGQSSASEDEVHAEQPGHDFGNIRLHNSSSPASAVKKQRLHASQRRARADTPRT